MSRARRRADRIREEVPLAQVLADYGYTVDANYDGEQQYSCDLHGDGQDNTPSARLYADNTSYCFACDQTRDALQTVMDREGKGFWDAIKSLEKRYKLPKLPWDDEDDDDRQEPSALSQVQAVLNPDRTWEDDARRVFKLLDGMTLDRDLPMRTMLSYWEAFDKVCSLVDKELLTEGNGRVALSQIREKAMDKLRATAGA